MKKFIYILLIAFTSALTITSCTDEEIKPQTEGSAAGGNGETGKL